MNGRDPSSLSRLRDALVAGAGGVFRNAIREPLVTCLVCATPVDGYTRCYACQQHHHQSHDLLADAVGIVTYAIEGAQSGYVMQGYKAQPRPVREHQTLVLLLSVLALQLHAACAGIVVGSPITHWSTVPSLRSPARPHPLLGIVRPFAPGSDVPLMGFTGVANPRTLDERHFTAGPVNFGPNSHVLLMDDTWASGGHAQSAVLALRAAGARHVSLLIVARWLRPNFGMNAAFIRERLGNDFDPLVCPWTGGTCP